VISILGANEEISRMSGIYEFDNNKLKLAKNCEGDVRPTACMQEDTVTLEKVKSF